MNVVSRCTSAADSAPPLICRTAVTSTEATAKLMASSETVKRKSWPAGSIGRLAARVPAGLIARQARRSAQQAECRPHFTGEQLGLFPGGEVPADIHGVVVGKVLEGPLGPALGWPIDVAGEDGDGDRERDIGGLL